MKNVVIVDYGIGNLLSVARALEAAGATPKITSDSKEICSADRLILPGVGAFGHCMAEINSRKLQDPLFEFVSKGRPLLGICVGMQVLHSIGKEFGSHDGLGLINGVVDRIPDASHKIPNTSSQLQFDKERGSQIDDGNWYDISHKIPYVGWAKLGINNKAPRNKLTRSLQGKWFYFVHGFMATPDDEADVLAHYNYNDVKVVACTAKNNILGTQFHPEKSGEAGLALLKEFLLD